MPHNYMYVKKQPCILCPCPCSSLPYVPPYPSVGTLPPTSPGADRVPHHPSHHALLHILLDPFRNPLQKVGTHCRGFPFC